MFLNVKSAAMVVFLLMLFMAAGAAGDAGEERTSGQWRYVLKDSGAIITGYVKKPAGVLVIPGKLAGVPVTGIGEEAFDGCDGLTGVIIPASVTEIAGNPFRGCPIKSIDVAAGNPAYELVEGVLFHKEQKTLVICPGAREGTYAAPEGVLHIGEMAFYGCGLFTDVIIPHGVTSIGSFAFADCYSLTGVTLPGSVTGIGDFAFHILNEKGDLVPNDNVALCVIKGSYAEQYAVENGIRYTYSEDDDAAQGQPSGAEPGDSSGGAAVAPAGEIRMDGSRQWKYILADGEAFIDGCAAVPRGDLLIPSEIDGHPVTGIGDMALENLEIDSVTIPAGVTRMGWNPFARCAVKNIRVASGNPVYADAKGVLFDREQNIMIAYPNEKKGKYTVPKGTLRIGESAFEWSAHITGCSIPGSVTAIGDRAFYMCQNLAAVTLAKGITEIGDSAFYDCRSLQKVTIPGSVAVIGDSAFFGCERLKTATLQKGVERIGDMAFMHCDGLTKVTIPDSVTSIGDSAFLGCESLKSLSVPASVTSIGADAFDNFHDDLTLSVRQGSYAEEYALDHSIPYKLVGPRTAAAPNTGKYRTDAGGQWKYKLEDGEAEITGYVRKPTGDLVIPGDLDGYPVTGLRENLFFECRDLISVVIPEGVRSIGDHAFSACTGLTSVTIPNSVTSLSDGVLKSCYSLTGVVIPDSVTSIGRWAFTSSGLTGVTIPDSVTSIGYAAFSFCKNLTSVTISNSVTALGESTFASSGLTSVTIPDSVTSVGMHVFGNCRDLLSVTIPASVTDISAANFFVEYRRSAVILTVEEGSYAEQYAKKEGIPYVFMQSSQSFSAAP